MTRAVEIERTVAGIPSPGSLLAAKREQYGWSIRDVAGAMRLSERQVQAIENDDYDNLPGKTYVMGYWRSYSQLLKISIDESIQVHRANLSSSVREITVEPSHQQVRGSEEKSRKRAALLFGCLLVAFLGAVWYWQDPDASIGDWIGAGLTTLGNGEPVTPEPISGGEIEPLLLPEPVISPSNGQSILALPEPNFSLGQQAVEINTRGYEVVIADLPLSRPDLTYLPWPEPTEAEVAAASATGSGDAQGVAQQTPEQQAAEAAAVAARQAAAEKARQQAAERARQEAARKAAAGGDRLISFSVAKESWIDVRDSTGERLIYRTVNRGEDIQLKGIPPYSVFIGSAEGVKVRYEGQDIPFKAHESGLFARFEVGAP